MQNSEVTLLLQRVSVGDAAAVETLLPLVYQELRAIAERYMVREQWAHTLQPTALVHEAYLRLVGADSGAWQGRSHFIGIAARAMRQILVDHARAKRTEKRGGSAHRVDLDAVVDAFEDRSVDLLALHEALLRLAQIDERQSQLVELRFFGGITMAGAAKILGLAERTAEREWRVARAWLRRELSGSESGDRLK